MIDSDKLKELCNLAEITKSRVTFEYRQEKSGDYFICFFAYDNKASKLLFFNSKIDYMIQELKNLLQIKPKFNIGDDVWCTCLDELVLCKIERIDSTTDGYEYYLSCNCYSNEHDLHLTKNEAIDAEIKYWESQRDD